MAKDAKGTEIQMGDLVLIRGRASRIEEGEEGCNVLFESLDPMFPAPQLSVFWANSRQLETQGQPPAPAATTAASPAPEVPVAPAGEATTSQDPASGPADSNPPAPEAPVAPAGN